MKDRLWLALSNVNGLGIKKLLSLYEKYPTLTVHELSALPESEILNVVRSKEVVKQLADYDAMAAMEEQAQQLIEIHTKQGIEVVTYLNDNYPSLLKLIPDPPVTLYCKGYLDALDYMKKIAIVGTRKATDKGLKVAEKIASQFAEMGYIIVSRLATGIDSAGHIGALNVRGITIGVLAGGIDHIYPKENIGLAESILMNYGLLVSEYPIGTKMHRKSFVKRYRIQSGLSLGVCAVQTDVEGGTMHTVRYTELQNRVLICPKPLESVELPVYRGIQKLLVEQRAELLESTMDYNRLDQLMKSNILNKYPHLMNRNN